VFLNPRRSDQVIVYADRPDRWEAMPVSDATRVVFDRASSELAGALPHIDPKLRRAASAARAAYSAHPADVFQSSSSAFAAHLENMRTMASHLENLREFVLPLAGAADEPRPRDFCREWQGDFDGVALASAVAQLFGAFTRGDVAARCAELAPRAVELFATFLLRRRPENLTVVVDGEVSHVVADAQWSTVPTADAATRQAVFFTKSLASILRHADAGADDVALPLVEHLELHAADVAAAVAADRLVLRRCSGTAVAYYAGTSSGELESPRRIARALLCAGDAS
jgi:hypothetical protein